jgi:hypothetical protein
MQYGHAAWTFCMDTLLGHEAWTCSMGMDHGLATWNMQRGHAAWAWSIDIKHGHAAKAWSMDTKHGHVAGTWGIDMDMQYGHAAFTYVQHGNAERTWSMMLPSEWGVFAYLESWPESCPYRQTPPPNCRPCGPLCLETSARHWTAQKEWTNIQTSQMALKLLFLGCPLPQQGFSDNLLPNWFF